MRRPHRVRVEGLVGRQTDGCEVVCLACTLVPAQVAGVPKGGVHDRLGVAVATTNSMLGVALRRGHDPPPDTTKPRALAGLGVGLAKVPLHQLLDHYGWPQVRCQVASFGASIRLAPVARLVGASLAGADARAAVIRVVVVPVARLDRRAAFGALPTGQLPRLQLIPATPVMLVLAHAAFSRSAASRSRMPAIVSSTALTRYSTGRSSPLLRGHWYWCAQ